VLRKQQPDRAREVWTEGVRLFPGNDGLRALLEAPGDS